MIICTIMGGIGSDSGSSLRSIFHIRFVLLVVTLSREWQVNEIAIETQDCYASAFDWKMGLLEHCLLFFLLRTCQHPSLSVC